ncbi:hypothetical protein Ahy_B01g054273 [Arachis hypogaea]|uniref:Aminotransferase-like plant mobile domain-containing protein n=1 Tax=Arachis hypogaea TaxID=3818 RepID=A0A445ATM0_ARAHY|nr:hypothetical protein Ahy_B01g054273 [Arachis hypogaea]
MDLMMEISVDHDEDRLTFKKVFILYIQMAFSLPTIINKVFSIHMPPLFRVETMNELNWGGHIFDFLIKGINSYPCKQYELNCYLGA